MESKLNIFAISGSTRKNSSNHQLIEMMLIIGSKITKGSQLIVPAIKTKLINDKITDDKTLAERK